MGEGGTSTLEDVDGCGGVERNGHKSLFSPALDPTWGWRISHPRCFLCPWNGSLVDYLLDWMPFCSVISSCPMAWRAQEGLAGGQSRGPFRACPAACVAPPPRSPAAPRFVPSPWWVLPSCFLTRHVLLAPHPISPPPCAVVPVVVSLWLFLGHSPPLSSFCEGKRPQLGMEDGVRGLSGPWDWAVSLAPTALRLGERAVVVVVVWFSFIFVECVFLWSGLWSGLTFVY